MTVTTSRPWADSPFTLLPLPLNLPDITNKDHASVSCAQQMTQVHNFFLRGLNSIIQQAPHVQPASSPSYIRQDVVDLLSYVRMWVEGLDKHHHIEETFIFPEIESFAGQKALMDGRCHQHETFTSGLKELLKYAKETPPEKYQGWTQGNESAH